MRWQKTAHTSRAVVVAGRNLGWHCPRWVYRGDRKGSRSIGIYRFSKEDDRFTGARGHVRPGR